MGTIGVSIALLAYTVAVVYSLTTAKLHPLSDELIDLINSKQTTWQAGRNFPSNTPIKYRGKQQGVQQNFNVQSLPRIRHGADLIASLPDKFDPREKWPNCPSLNEIRDEGSCDSSWAVSAVAAMTDRVCTYSNGKKQFHFSAQDLVSCCSDCGSCCGGDPKMAWKYWMVHGIVSGGNYNSSQGCRPYSIPTCVHLEPGYVDNSTETICIDKEFIVTPKCLQTCANNYQLAYHNDKHYGKNAYSIVNEEDHIKAELYQNGPVQAVFLVYADFFDYEGGVYQHVDGDYVYEHAVKILGWGVEEGTKYWLAANSWNTDWGEDGFFKILRGEDHCGIEGYIMAGLPLIEN